MGLNATGRKVLSDVLKNAARFEQENAIATYFTSISCKGSGDIEPLGTVMKYSVTNSAWYPFTAPSDWAAATVTTVGTVVKPTTRNGFEYVCTAITGDATTHATTEPTWPTVPGVSVLDDVVTWVARYPYPKDPVNSPLPDGSMLAITLGAKEGLGFNKEDVTLSSTAVKMTALYRGEAGVAEDELEWNSADAEDIAEAKIALEQNGIIMVDSLTTVVPSFV